MKTKQTIIDKVKGLFSNSPAYTPLLESGDSSPYFGTYETQKYGKYDTSCCWDFAASELLETRLEMLSKMSLIPTDTLKWLNDSGYIDITGDFYLSRRWIAILSAVQNAGNEEIHFWDIAGKAGAGVIPNKMLPYSQADAFDEYSQDDFNNEYFDPQVITKDMELMGIEFAKRFKLEAVSMTGGYFKDISVKLQTYLKEGSMQIGIPVPQDGSWNQEKVKFTNRFVADHSVELYKFDPTSDYPFYIYDTYEPHLKRLSQDYYVPVITRVVVTPISIPAKVPISPLVSNWSKFWYNIYAWIKGIKQPYPEVLIGKVGA